MSRRRALQVGAGLAAAATPAVAPTGAARSDAGGRCVIVYDDAPEADYTKAFPVHREEGAPGCIAVPSAYLAPPEGLSPDQMVEMADAGWEVLSHTVHHEPVGAVGLAADAAAGDTRLTVSFGVHGRDVGAPVTVLDGAGNSFTTTVDGGERGSGPDTVVLRDPVPFNLEASAGARIRFADEFLAEKLAHSKAALEDHGVTVNNLVAPYQIYDRHAADLAAEHYHAVANGTMGDGLNHEIDPYRLDRTQLVDLAEAEIRARAREAARRDSLLLFGGHSWNEDLPQAQIRTLIRTVREEGLAITTLSEVLREAGVIDPADAPEGTPSATDRPDTVRTRSAPPRPPVAPAARPPSASDRRPGPDRRTSRPPRDTPPDGPSDAEPEGVLTPLLKFFELLVRFVWP